GKPMPHSRMSAAIPVITAVTIQDSAGSAGSRERSWLNAGTRNRRRPGVAPSSGCAGRARPSWAAVSDMAEAYSHAVPPAEHSPPGGLILAGAPLGDPADASPRLRAALAAAPVIAAEDTRRLRRLAAALEVPLAGRVVSYYDANERARIPGLLAALHRGEDVLVITDAGMPGVSDPGYRLVAAAVAEGIPVTAVPGPSAVTTALALSGLPCDRFCFEGFLPRRAGERRAALTRLAGEARTLVFFEAPHRAAAAL